MTEAQQNPNGKGKPTPPRREQEAARKRPLVGGQTKEAKKAAQEKLREERRKARDGMMAGEERYLTARDRGPQRKFVRDLVDSRFTAGELVLPMLFVVVLITFIDDVRVQYFAVFGMWGLFLFVGFDAWLISRTVKKRAATKFGDDRVERGLGWYGAMRSIQMRALRIPKPQVSRGSGRFKGFKGFKNKTGDSK